MKKFIFSLIVFGAIISAPANVSALSLFDLPGDSGLEILKKPEEKPKKPEKIVYKAQKGDSLTKIAKKYDTTIKRLFYKNTEIKYPDSIKAGQKIVIPKPDEKLKRRQLAIVEETPVIQPISGNTAGNTYAPLYCTWGVKNWTPWIPNGLGNASEWGYKMPVRSNPQVGDVAWTTRGWGGHVGLVLAVKGNMVKTKEMNNVGLGVTSYHWTPASSWSGFIYN